MKRHLPARAIVAILAIACHTSVRADNPARQEAKPLTTYLLSCPQPNSNIQLKVVDRDQIDKAVIDARI